MRTLALRCLASLGLVLALAATAGAQAQWRSEGPFLATASDVAVDPKNPDTVYLATHGGGIWRSDDGGKSWTLPGDEMTSRQVVWVMVDPAKSTTVWAGIDDAGMWRSLDRGATWKTVKPDNDSLVGLRPAFAPSAPQNIFVPSTNLHWKSADGGKTWTSFRVSGQDSYAMAVHPTNPKIVISGGAGQTLNLSRTQDGGKTWKAVGIGIRKTSVHRLIIDPGHPSTVYAFTGFHDVFKSTDMGDNFEPLDVGMRDATDEIDDLDIDPNDSQTLWASTDDGLRVSHDGGETWRVSEEGTGAYVINGVALVPGHKGLIYAASKGGLGAYKSTDGGASWSATSQGVAAGWVSKVWATGKSLFAQTGAGLYRRDPGGAWTEVRQPFEDDKEAELDGMLVDRASPGTVYAYNGSKYWRSSDGGRTWKQAEQKEPGLRQMMRGDISSAEFKSMAQDGGDAKTFYAGAWSGSESERNVFKTTDGGKNWKPAAKGLPEGAIKTLVSPAPKVVYAVVEKEGVYRSRDGGGSWTSAGSGLPGGEIRQLVASPKDPSQLFAATEHGLFSTSDGGGSWNRTDSSLGEDDVEAVVYGPNGDVFAGAFEGVYHSTDGGGSWKKMNGSLANVDVRALAIEPGSSPRLYAGFGGGSIWSTPLP